MIKKNAQLWATLGIALVALGALVLSLTGLQQSSEVREVLGIIADVTGIRICPEEQCPDVPGAQAVRERIGIDSRVDSYLYWAADLIFYSDDHSTQVFAIDGATGNIDSEGSLLGDVDLEGGTLTIDADNDTTMSGAVDDRISMTTGVATGTFNVITGNLKVGNGTPSVSLNGEDFYVEGSFEGDGAARFDGAIDANSTLDLAGAFTGSTTVDVGTFLNLSAQTAISLSADGTITPTGTYQPLTSGAAVTTSTSTAIADGSAAGDLLVLENQNASDVITIDGTGANVECKADFALGAGDTAGLIWDGSDWQCLFVRDNS